MCDILPRFHINCFQISDFISFFSVALRPNAGHGLLILDVSRSHTTTYNSRQDSSGRVISSSQRPLPDRTQHSQQTNIHSSGGIRTRDLNRRAAVDLLLKPRGHWDRQISYSYIYIYIYIYGMYKEPKIILALSVSTEDCCDRRYFLCLCVFVTQCDVIRIKYSIVT